MNSPQPLEILDCDDCGVCCMFVGHPWFLRHSGDPLWEQLPQHLQQEVNDHIAGLADVDTGEPCIWYDADTRKCKHYEYRPQMCRDFEAGCDGCRRMRKQYGIDG